jgi:putative two-component system response regulator
MGASKKKKILVVDDDEITTTHLETILKRNYTVSAFKSGKEALESLYHGYVPDLVLLDVLMPGMDGWEVFSRIKAIISLHDVPIVFLSSITEESQINRAYLMGAADFITKSCEKKELLARLKKVMEKSNLQGNYR